MCGLEFGLFVEMAGPGICVLCSGGYLCTQSSNLLHFIDICFLTCICMWQISQIQTSYCVFVGPGLVSTSPVFMKSSASPPAGLHDGQLPLK